jgi:hypothetical protein
MSYDEVYNFRLFKDGNNYQERIQTKRERLFELYMNRSVYKINFQYNGETHPGTFERMRQDNTKTLQYLLTRVTLDIPNGTILMLPDSNKEEKPWMVYYIDEIEASGYNRYIMLKMTHFLTWTARDGSTQTSWAYMYGQENNMLKDELKSRSRNHAIYNENLKSSFFIMPVNTKINREDYFIIGEGELQEYYRVTGFDRQSTPGVEFVTIDPVYEYDLTPPPIPTPEDKDEDFFWLGGGADD